MVKKVHISENCITAPTYCWGWGYDELGRPVIYINDNPTLNIVCDSIIEESFLPSIGEEGDIYVTSDTYKIYSWDKKNWIKDNLIDTQFVTDLSNSNVYQFYKGSLIDVDPSTITVNGISPNENGNIEITKADIGLSNVDNTSDINKPISTATQTALDLKVNNSSINITGGIASFDSLPFVANRGISSSNVPYPVLGDNYLNIELKKKVHYNGTMWVSSDLIPGQLITIFGSAHAKLMVLGQDGNFYEIVSGITWYNLTYTVTGTDVMNRYVNLTSAAINGILVFRSGSSQQSGFTVNSPNIGQVAMTDIVEGEIIQFLYSF